MRGLYVGVVLAFVHIMFKPAIRWGKDPLWAISYVNARRFEGKWCGASVYFYRFYTYIIYIIMAIDVHNIIVNKQIEGG